MKIAYDAKRFFHNTSGLGNYSRDLVRILSQYYSENEYFLLLKIKMNDFKSGMNKNESRIHKNESKKYKNDHGMSKNESRI